MVIVVTVLVAAAAVISKSVSQCVTQLVLDEPTSPTGTSYSLSFDMDSVSSILPAYKPIKAIAELPSTLSENPLTLTSTQQPHDSVNSSLISGYQSNTI